jgi:hypothetical protein
VVVRHNVPTWTTWPLESRTVRVTETSIPSTGHSIAASRSGASTSSAESEPRTTFQIDGRLHVVVRLLGTLQIS